jgi:ABC-type cobalamin transport system ATPase subunit
VDEQIESLRQSWKEYEVAGDNPLSIDADTGLKMLLINPNDCTGKTLMAALKLSVVPTTYWK